jgi:hypothetical protein
MVSRFFNGELQVGRYLNILKWLFGQGVEQPFLENILSANVY